MMHLPMNRNGMKMVKAKILIPIPRTKKTMLKTICPVKPIPTHTEK
jgi:hypothetical protein